MATGYTREWIHFFTGCGIPDDVATMYALIFYENRIQKNMLPDLNKEYLRDMGITVMGDVIAILRYAKVVHEKYVRDQILSVDNKALDSKSQANESSPVVKKSPMKRMLEHYTRKYNSSDVESVSDVQVILPNTKSNTVQKKLTPSTGIENHVPVKKKVAISVKQANLIEERLEVPVPKVRRVLPENEGGYKIKMPSGSTARSKKLLQLAKIQKTTTVFDRLGESSVSSTTSEMTVGTSSSSSSLNSSREKNLSVFSRLGEKTPVVSSTSVDEVEVEGDQLQLPYAGILKGGGSVQKKNLPNTTMRADNEPKQSEVSKLTLKKRISVKKRLGLSQQEQNQPEADTQTKRTVLKAVKQASRLKGGDTKVSSLGTTNKFVSSSASKKVTSQSEGILAQSFTKTGTESAVGGLRTQAIGERISKRKLEANSDSEISPSKKVRFGRTTHRLIPSTSNSLEPINHVKNYPKLTMIISNRTKVTENNAFSPGVKTGPLKSDRIRQKVAVQERIGNKPIRRRLGNRFERQTSGVRSKNSSIHDRLG